MGERLVVLSKFFKHSSDVVKSDGHPERITTFFCSLRYFVRLLKVEESFVVFTEVEVVVTNMVVIYGKL